MPRWDGPQRPPTGLRSANTSFSVEDKDVGQQLQAFGSICCQVRQICKHRWNRPL